MWLSVAAVTGHGGDDRSVVAVNHSRSGSESSGQEQRWPDASSARRKTVARGRGRPDLEIRTAGRTLHSGEGR
ncbi:hypothetical protein M6B38_232585 [Iris pallida]|uniref:Uncharacterized protein n=1 Tax=Iris pallida TaxID=29817 RepID=A0AAX6DRR4_IRIPA|nr:hypothetical protein M6B38_232585 [Iris pallida]